MGAMGTIAGYLGRRLVRSLARLYYPRIEIEHAERIPSTGPVLLAANHPNSMLDPILIGIAARRPMRFLAKAPLFKIPLVGALLRALGMLPAYRESDDPSQVGKNVDTLGAGAELLAQGFALGIFPEGKTHDLQRVELVRSGAARIAMQALERGAGELRVVPLGINYECKDRFRSAVWIRVGEPIVAATWLQEHGNDPRHAMRRMTAEIDRQLKELAVHLNEDKWEPFLADLEILMPAPPEAAQMPAAPLRQRKRIADAMNYFLAANRPRAEAVAEEITRYRANLFEAGLTPQSPILMRRGFPLFMKMAGQLLWLAVCFLPALVGTLYHLLPFFTVRLSAARLQTPGRTTISFARLGLGIPVYLLWYALVGWVLVQRLSFNTWLVWAWSALMPFAGLLALGYWRRARDLGLPWWRQFVFFFRRDKLEELRNDQFLLRIQLKELGDEYARSYPPLRAQPVLSVAGRGRRRLLGWSLAAGALLVLVFGISRFLEPPIPELAQPGPDLRQVSSERLAAPLEADEKALSHLLSGLEDLEARARTIRDEFATGKRSYYNQSDNDALRPLLLSYMNQRTALLRLIWKYQNYRDVKDERLRLRVFLACYGSAVVLYEASLKFITQFNRSEETVKKLNEAEPLWDVPSGVYDMLRRSLARSSHQRLLEEARKEYLSQRALFEEYGLWEGAPYAGFHAAIQRAHGTIADLGPSFWREKVSLALQDTKDLGAGIAYRAQSVLASWIGDTKLREPREGQTLIGSAQLAELRKMLRPGDILLERRNWFLSNAFLPGYWPHAALYVGRPEELQALGIDQDPRVQKHWKKFAADDEHGHAHVIVEALSEGVVCATLEHSIGGGDSVAVLRPRLPPARIREAIGRGFSHVGKCYDFEFDFFSTDKIVCTELVFRAYGGRIEDGDIRFDLVDVMGRKTLPAIEIVRKFANERGKPDAQMELIAFLDGDEKTGTCPFCDEAAFVHTLQRPGMTWLQGFVKP